MGIFLTNQMVHYLLIKMTISQNDQSNGPYYTSFKNHSRHNGHVKINLSKMTKWHFDIYQNWVF
jgi:hypothetical protein